MNVTLHPESETTESETVQGRLGSQKVINEEDCATGRCWVMQASDRKSAKPPTASSMRFFEQENAELVSSMTTVKGSYNVQTMLPVEVSVEHIYELRLEEYEGIDAVASQTTGDRFRFEIVDEVPKRATIGDVSNLFLEYEKP